MPIRFAPFFYAFTKSHETVLEYPSESISLCKRPNVTLSHFLAWIQNDSVSVPKLRYAGRLYL